MPNYDFKSLSPHDFEQLSRDLIQERDGVILESFKTGRDQGIDFRCARAPGSIVVQCKHYVGTGLSGLLADLKKEAAKAVALNPQRYMLVTSVGLTPQNKSSIQQLFGSMLSTFDILGPDDLNNLLGIHPTVEQRHYKLWLTSRAALDKALFNASITQSEFDVARVHRDIQRYVRNDAYPRALEMLDTDHVTIISGAPGVGKTSLAKMLLYAHLERGYETISILTDFQTGRERFQAGKKQIFYFDDFIGATFLGERASTLTRNEDRAILDFIELIQSSPTARLVMTTREHILQQAIATSEKLNHSDLISNRCVLEISDYSRNQRAEILYNHIYFSELPSEYRAALLANRFYKTIVLHSKFNPRLIEWLSNYRRVKLTPPDQYQEFVRNLLANPAEIWRHAYEHQISDSARSLLLALFTLNGRCEARALESAFLSLNKLRSQRYAFKTAASDWRTALGELNGSFIRPGAEISVIDPSVLDMLNAAIRQDPLNALDMVEGSVYFEQLTRMWKFSLADGSSSIMNSFKANETSVSSSLARLLSAPQASIPISSKAFFESRTEIRICTAIEVAGALQSSLLAQTTKEAIEKLLKLSNENGIDIRNGLALRSKIKSSKYGFSKQEREILHQRITLAIATTASQGCYSYELRELLEETHSESLSDDIRELLSEATDYYLDDLFGSELQQCSSGEELQGLEEDLAIISSYTNANVNIHLESVRESLNESTSQQADYEERLYEEWRDSEHYRPAEDHSIDDLFDSLKPH